MGFRTRIVRKLFVVALLSLGLAPHGYAADSPSTSTFEPFFGYEVGTVKMGLVVPPFSPVTLNKSVSGLSGGMRIGMKKEKGFWGIGAEVGTASVGARNMSYVKPFDLGIFITHYWRGGFRIRGGAIPYTTAGETQGMAFKAGFGILLAENFSVNLEYIYRHYNKLTTEIPRATFDGRIVTGLLSVGFPFGEVNTWRKSGQDTY